MFHIYDTFRHRDITGASCCSGSRHIRRMDIRRCHGQLRASLLIVCHNLPNGVAHRNKAADTHPALNGCCDRRSASFFLDDDD